MTGHLIRSEMLLDIDFFPKSSSMTGTFFAIYSSNDWCHCWSNCWRICTCFGDDNHHCLVYQVLP